MSALVDTGLEVTVLHGDIAPNEATPKICVMGGEVRFHPSHTPIPPTILQAKATLTIGDTIPIVMQMLIAPVEECILGTDMLAGQKVETLNGHFGTWKVGFAIQSITVLHEFPKWDPAALPAPAKLVNVK